MINRFSYHKWYWIPQIKFKIISYCKNREVAFIRSKYFDYTKLMVRRNNRMHSVQHMDFFLKRIPFRKYAIQMYYSLAKYKNGIPYQSPNFNLNRNDSSFKNWKLEHYKEMVGYDMLIDIDPIEGQDLQEGIKDTYESAKLVHKHLENQNIIHDIRFSGAGFHIIVPYQMLPDHLVFEKNDTNTVWAFATEYCKRLSEKYSELIDVHINDSRRLCKIPYTLAIFPMDVYVCYPFENSKEFLNFKIKDMEPDSVLFNLCNKSYADFVLGDNKKLMNQEESNE